KRLEHREAPPLAHDQVLLDEGLECRRRSLTGLDARLPGEATGEDGQPREQHALAEVKQVIAPVDRRAKALMTHGRVARTADEDRQSSVELLKQLLRSKRVASRG